MIKIIINLSSNREHSNKSISRNDTLRKLLKGVQIQIQIMSFSQGKTEIRLSKLYTKNCLTLCQSSNNHESWHLSQMNRKHCWHYSTVDVGISTTSRRFGACDKFWYVIQSRSCQRLIFATCTTQKQSSVNVKKI